MGLRIKILSGFLILVLMLAIAGIMSVYELNSIGSSVQQILDENYRSISLSKKMIEDVEREDSGILLLLLGKWGEGRKIINSADSSFKVTLEIAYGNITIEGERERLDLIKEKYAEYKNLWEKPIVDTDKEGNLTWYFSKIHTAFGEVKKALDALILLNDGTMYNTASKIKDSSTRAIMPGIVAIVASLVFTGILIYFVNYYMVAPIINITDKVKMFIQNNLPFKIEIETKDEIFELANSIRKMSEYITSRENSQ
jgi:methyl-accepting chemotaxis protein